MRSIYKKKGIKFELSIALLLIIVMVPFNDLPIFSLKQYFGEFYSEGSFYAFLVCIVFVLISFIKNKSIIIPKNASVKFLMLFLIYNVICGLVNYSNIIASYTKGRTGMQKYLGQIQIVIFCILISIVIYYICRKSKLNFFKVRAFLLVSLSIVILYSFIEIPGLFGNAYAISILEKINPIIHGANGHIMYLERLGSVSTEASSISMYFIFIFPWIISYVFTSKHKSIYLIINIYLFVMILLTKSRTGYVVILIECIIFVYMLFKDVKKIKIKLILFILAFSMIMFGISLKNVKNDFSETSINNINITETLQSLNDSNNLSNIARFGSQKAALRIGIKNPIFGIGIGQYGFYMPNYVDDKTMTSPEILSWMNNADGTTWPPVHGLFARIICENGFVGLVLWLVIWIYVLYKCISIVKRNDSDYFGISIITSIVGLLFLGFDSDSFRFMGYWITLGIAWFYIYSNNVMNTVKRGECGDVQNINS